MMADGDRPAIVITGASSGVGREMARLAPRDGRALVLIGRSDPELQKLVEELRAQQVEAVSLGVDLQHADSLSRIEALLAEHKLYCDILVNSAGFGVFGAIADTDYGLQLELIDVNIKAGVALILRFLPGMIGRDRGGIINVASITAYSPGPLIASYCASKAFIRSYSAALAAEVAGTGVTVTCLTPGVLRTAFFERKFMKMRTRLMKLLPRGDPAQAARAAWLAFEAGKTKVVPRMIDRFIIGLCSAVPDRWLSRFVKALQRRA